MTVEELKQEMKDCDGNCGKCAWCVDDTCDIADAFFELDAVKDKCVDTSTKWMLRVILNNLAKKIDEDMGEK